MVELQATGVTLQRDVKSAAASAVQDALKALQGDIESARRVVVDLQGLSLWRAAWQHAMVALVAMAVTLLAVWWYVPSVSEMSALRSERDQLQASIEDLTQRGGRRGVADIDLSPYIKSVSVNDLKDIYLQTFCYIFVATWGRNGAEKWFLDKAVKADGRRNTGCDNDRRRHNGPREAMQSDPDGDLA
jgi:hypothetical protein